MRTLPDTLQYFRSRLHVCLRNQRQRANVTMSAQRSVRFLDDNVHAHGPLCERVRERKRSVSLLSLQSHVYTVISVQMPRLSLIQ